MNFNPCCAPDPRPGGRARRGRGSGAQQGL